MIIAKYFWDLKEGALRETKKILKNSQHPKFTMRMATFLSRCDKPKELFSVISKKEFVKIWPKIRVYWVKRIRQSEFRDWWETIYEQLLDEYQHKQKRAEGKTPAFFREFGKLIKEARVEKGLSQKQLAFRIGMKQPDISRVEEGKKNITMFTLIRLSRILGIKRVDIS
ncbi:MAG: helix-turn-helix domain-containing protein [Candidatus Omnitrophica bacterium]|nr:helix-turn-helix domain-containing protein [Candidatus Omnitrophota bacterium]